MTTKETSQVNVDCAVTPPPLYRVVLYNDDYTPMDFVVQVLQQFFGLSEGAATEVMWAVHEQGRGICGLYPADIAATKVAQVRAFARLHEHPLRCDQEKDL